MPDSPTMKLTRRTPTAVGRRARPGKAGAKRASAPDAAPQVDAAAPSRDGATPKGADPSKPSNYYDSSPKGADPSKPANRGQTRPTTPLRVSANYENIPGTSKNGPTVGGKQTALWFNPLAIKREGGARLALYSFSN
jgi:hypothetical protein